MPWGWRLSTWRGTRPSSSKCLGPRPFAGQSLSLGPLCHRATRRQHTQSCAARITAAWQC